MIPEIVDYRVTSIFEGSLLVNGVAQFPLSSAVDGGTVRDVLHGNAMDNNGRIDDLLTIDLAGTVVTGRSFNI